MSWKKGERAEAYVKQRLVARGWLIRSQNFRRKGLEIDLIASRGERLICVEVKARAAQGLGDLGQVLGYRKMERLKMGMRLWLQQEAPDERRNTEFWLCSVRLPTQKHEVLWCRIEI